MKKFLIGQHTKFSEAKHLRDYRDEFWGYEVCSLTDESDLQALKEKKKEGVQLGVHFPMKKGLWEHRDPQLMSLDPKIREVSYAYLEAGVKEAAAHQPDYILIHYPKPVVLYRENDFLNRGWWFHCESEFVYDDEMSLETFRDSSEVFFDYFSKLGVKYDFKPVIELDAITTYITETDVLTELLDRYPNIGVCIDIGRLHIQNEIDDRFDAFELIKKLGKYIVEVHLWNVQVQEKLSNGHYPTLEDLKPEDGWADVPKYFKVINEHVKDYSVLFEHRSDLISDEQLQACYDWIRALSEGA